MLSVDFIFIRGGVDLFTFRGWNSDKNALVLLLYVRLGIVIGLLLCLLILRLRVIVFRVVVGYV